ncbi:MAG: hypothetical protein IJ174_01045, partial [Clostridia bacterium]|nr:hypothetical protein [Clostridia bacterium]
MKKYCFLLLFVLLFTAVAAQADSLSSLSGNKEAKVAECYAEMEFKEEDGPWWVVISDKEGNRLNLREKPNKSAKSLAKYFAGTIVRQLEPAKGGWMLVEIGPMTGYVDVDYLQEGTAYKENEIKLVTVHNENGTGANLRSAPNTDRSKVIRTLSNGKTAYAIGVLPEGWLQLLYKNEYYFAKASLFTPLLQMSLDEIHIGKKGVYYVYNPNPADRLNLRKNATAEAASFAKFYGGTALEVIDFDQTHEW